MRYHKGAAKNDSEFEKMEELIPKSVDGHGLYSSYGKEKSNTKGKAKSKSDASKKYLDSEGKQEFNVGKSKTFDSCDEHAWYIGKGKVAPIVNPLSFRG